jgi:hypothetical protein
MIQVMVQLINHAYLNLPPKQEVHVCLAWHILVLEPHVVEVFFGIKIPKIPEVFHVLTYLALADQTNLNLEVGHQGTTELRSSHLNQSMATGKLSQCGTSSYLS